MKTMKFRGFKADWIMDGTKMSSMRLFDDKNLQTGDDVEFVNWDTGEVFAHAYISSVTEKKLGELTEIDFEGHEKFESTDSMYANFRKYYGNTVGPHTFVKIVRFSVV